MEEESYNQTTKQFGSYLFKKGIDNPLLKKLLKGIYVDDYLHDKKYVNCFYVVMRYGDIYDSLEINSKVAQHPLWMDYYTVEDEIIHLFKIPQEIEDTVKNFKLGELGNYDYELEIYRADNSSDN